MNYTNKIKAYFIFLFSGWRSVKIFGNPKNNGDYIVCFKNNEVMQFTYSTWEGNVRWFRFGVGDECKENPVIFWKPLPKPPCGCC